MQIKRPFIVDIWSANRVTDWNVADGYFICASWDLNMGEDEAFGINWPEAGQAKKPRGAYFSVNMTLSTADQAKAFVAILNKYGGLKPGDKLAADCEVGQLSISAIIDFIWNVEQMTGVRPMLYSRAELLNALNFSKLNAGQLAYVKTIDIWSAGYPSNPDLFSTPPSGYIPDPSAYGPTKIWQYAGDVDPASVGLNGITAVASNMTRRLLAISGTSLQTHLQNESLVGVTGGIDLNWIDPDYFTTWQAETLANQPAPAPQPVPAPTPQPAPGNTPEPPGSSTTNGNPPAGTNVGSQIHHEDSGSVGSAYDKPLPGTTPAPSTPPEVQSIRYGIVKTFIIRNNLTLNGKYTPAVCQVNDRPVVKNFPGQPDDGRVGKGNPLPIAKLPKLQNYIRKTNNAAGAHYALDTVGAMWINTPGQAESIMCQHNFVSWDPKGDTNGCHKLLCFADDENFDLYLDANGNPTVTWETRPELFFKANALNLDGHFINVANDVDCLIPLCAEHVYIPQGKSTGELWIAAIEVEEFPALPFTATILPGAAAGTHLNIHAAPGFADDVIGEYTAGDVVTFYQYRPLGANVFARTDKGWICALKSTKPGERIFETSWQLETEGVIPPV